MSGVPHISFFVAIHGRQPPPLGRRGFGSQRRVEQALGVLVEASDQREGLSLLPRLHRDVLVVAGLTKRSRSRISDLNFSGVCFCQPARSFIPRDGLPRWRRDRQASRRPVPFGVAVGSLFSPQHELNRDDENEHMHMQKTCHRPPSPDTCRRSHRPGRYAPTPPLEPRRCSDSPTWTLRSGSRIVDR